MNHPMGGTCLTPVLVPLRTRGHGASEDARQVSASAPEKRRGPPGLRWSKGGWVFGGRLWEASLWLPL